MPEWLLILLLFLAFGMVLYCAYQWGHQRGYDAGHEDSLDVGRQLDRIMRSTDGPNRPPQPPKAGHS
jgi:hypothetical protein